MNNQPRLPYRRTDPDTSRAAAIDAAPRMPRIRDVVYDLMKAHGPMTEDELCTRYHWGDGTGGSRTKLWQPATDQGVRSRCAELIRDGFLERVPGQFGVSATGRKAGIVRAVSREALL